MSGFKSIKFANDEITKMGSGALMVAEPTIIFDGKTLGADDTDFLWQNAGTGTFAWANNMCSMSVTSGQYCIRQSRRFMHYVSGYLQLIETTLDNFDTQVNTVKRIGYFSSSAVAPHTANYDGSAIVNDGTTYRIVSWNDGTETSNRVITSWKNYALISTYNFDNFTAIMTGFLWLGGAYHATWLATADSGWILADYIPFVGNNKGTLFKSPSQPVRYEIVSSTGTGDMRAICSQVSIGGNNVSNVGNTIIAKNSASIACNTIGTIYALQGFKKNATYRDLAIKISEIGCVNGATTDTGILMLIRNPTLSAPLTYAAYEKIDRAIATTQTVTDNTGTIVTIHPNNVATEASQEENYRAWFTQTITNTFDEYVLCYLSTSSNQDIRGLVSLKQY
jgi:hypothetical protein